MMKSPASDGAFMKGWTDYFLKWCGFYYLGVLLLFIKKILTGC